MGRVSGTILVNGPKNGQKKVYVYGPQLIAHRDAVKEIGKVLGKDVTIKVTKDTKVKSKPVLKVEEIKAGTRVVVTATEAKEKSFTAKTIEVGVATAPAK